MRKPASHAVIRLAAFSLITFATTCSITWNGAAQTTSFINSGQLTTTISASLIASAGTANVTVAAAGQMSPSPLTFTISPSLSLSNLQPNSAAAGGPSFLLTVNGSGFTNATSITWNGAAQTTSFINSGQLTTTISASLIASAGTANVTVAAAGQMSPSPLTFTISPSLSLSNLQPNSAAAGGPSFLLTVNGSGFTNATSITWNGAAQTTSFINSGQLTTTISASLIASAGTANVTVAAAGQMSPSPLTFTISPSLSLSNLQPNSTAAGGPSFLLTVNGSGFTNATSITWNGAAQTTSFINSGQLTTTISASLIASAGTANVTVAAAGQMSPSPLTFTISPSLSLSNLQPSSTAAGGPSFLLTVNGSGFTNATSITWNGAAQTTSFINSGQLTTTISASLIASAGTANVTVAAAGQMSPSPLTFTTSATGSMGAAPINSVLFAGLGGHNNGDSSNDGALAIVNQTTGAVTIVGHPTGVSRISGMAFDPTGVLFASTQPQGGFPPPPGPTGASQLLQLNPANGVILANNLITDGVNGISIADLAVQPGTGTLYGIRGPNDQLNGQGILYTINKSTGLATLVGNTGHFFGAIAFDNKGTLYATVADLDAMGDFVNPSLLTVNPATGATLSMMPLVQPIMALGVRPEDGVIFGGNGDKAQLFTIDPTRGTLTLVGDTGSTFIGDFDFQAPLIVPPGQCVPLPVNLISAAPAGEILTFTSSDSSKAITSLGSEGLFIPSGATTDRRTPQVCGVSLGTATISVTVGSQLLFSQALLVTETLSFQPSSITATVGLQSRPFLVLSAPAANDLTVSLTSDNAAIASVPASVAIPANSSIAVIPVTPNSSGTTMIHASASGLQAATLAVTVH